MQNMIVHPALATVLARVITQRSIATDRIAKVIAHNDFKLDDYLFWRNEHIEATRKLAALGIKLPTYDAEVPHFTGVLH